MGAHLRGLVVALLAAWLLVACAPPAPASQSQVGAATPATSRAESAGVLEAKVAQAPTRALPVRLTILHTNDVRGYVDPCG